MTATWIRDQLDIIRAAVYEAAEAAEKQDTTTMHGALFDILRAAETIGDIASREAAK